MARKNGNAPHKRPKLDIPFGQHFLYSVRDDGGEASIVRFMGDQDNDFLWCRHADGYRLWIHVSQLSNVPKRRTA